MEELFTNYSVSEIVIFVIILAIAVKEVVTFVDWGNARMGRHYDKDFKSEQDKRMLTEKVNTLDKFCNDAASMFDKINKRLDMLVESDKEDIKSYIVREHHYFVYQKEWIDDYSLECVERRFAVYRQEHGNSFVEGLMNEIRALPKQPPEPDRYKYVGTAEYVKNAKK